MFIGMWNFADDLGRLALAPKTLKAQIFPSDDLNSQSILGMVSELITNGLVLKYEVEGREYLQIVGWQHQRIDKPQPGKCPGPVNGYSKNDPGMVATEGKVVECSGKEGNSEANASGAGAPVDPSIAEREFFQRGREVLGKNAGGLLAKLKTSRGHNVSLARAAIETAATKQNPAEYIAAIIRGPPVARPTTMHQQRQAEGKAILDELHEFNTGSSRGEDSRLLRHDPGDGTEGVCSGSGGNLVELSAGGSRSRG